MSRRTKTPTRIRFTKKALDAITCPPSGRPGADARVWVHDEEVRGLAYCVTERGARSFYLVKWANGRTVRIRLDAAADLSIDQARRMAADMKSEVRQGIDPRRKRAEARAVAAAVIPTLADLWESYRDAHLAHKKPKTRGEFIRLYDAHLAAWKNRPLVDIASTDVETLKIRVGKAHGTYTANRVLAILSAMFRARGHLFGLPKRFTPTVDVAPFPEKARDRVLTPEELSAVLAAIDAEPNEVARDYFRMLLYTGARRANVAGMKWDDVSLQRSTWKIPGETFKNGQPLVVNLVEEAKEILARREKDNPADSPYVFPARRVTPDQVKSVRELLAAGHTTYAAAAKLGVSQSSVCRIASPGFQPQPPRPFDGAPTAWKRILAAAGVTQRTTIHDLRRTFCTNLIENGVQLPHVAAAMGHKTLATTQKHYAIAREEKVRESVTAGVAGMLAAAARAGEAKKEKQKVKLAG
ncbi:MAG TPA: site-specific integrase [Phycisphaerae bacterium]|nr:site-specific integrase [Phycisphaerae bacterium]